MNDYALKVRARDIPQLYALAVALGVLTPLHDADGQPTGLYGLTPEHASGGWDVVGPISRPTGEVIYGEPQEVPEYAEVVTQVPHESLPEVFTEVRTWEPTGKVNTVTPEIKVTALVADEDGIPYWHANLRLEASLMQIAREKAAVDPAVAAGLANLARWFVTGEDGRAAAQPGNGGRETELKV